MFSDQQFNQLVKKNATIIVFISSETESSFWDNSYIFSKAYDPCFNASFVVITDENAPETYKTYQIGSPGISIFYNCQAKFAFSIPQDSVAIQHVLSVTILNKTYTAQSVEEFKEFYFRLPRTFICTESNAEQTRFNIIRHSYSRGPFGFCVVPQSFFASAGMDPSSNLAIYRSNEDEFTAINDTDYGIAYGCNDYVNYEIDDYVSTHTSQLIVTAYGYPNKTNIPFLGAAKVNHKHLYGYFDQFANIIYRPLIESCDIQQPYITVINTTGFYMYEPLKTDKNPTAGDIIKYLISIESGKIPRMFATESKSNEIERDPNGLYHLTGKTYSSFLSNSQYDDMVFFIYDENSNISRILTNLTQYFHANNVTGIRLSYIDATRNSASEGFYPSLIEPQPALYLKNNRTHPIPYIGSFDIYPMVDFLNTYREEKIPNNESLIDPEYEFQTIQNLHMIYTITGKEEMYYPYRNYSLKIGTKLGFGSNITEILNYVFKDEENDDNVEYGDDNDEKTDENDTQITTEL